MMCSKLLRKLAEDLLLTNPARSSKWLQRPFIKSKLNFEIRIYGLDGGAPTENADLLTLATSEIGEIQEEQDVITVHYGNGVVKFPSKVTFADVDWTLNCYCSPNVLEQLRIWRSQVYDPNSEKMGVPSQFMRTVYFIKYNGQGVAQDCIKAPGTWIRGLSNGAMNQEGGSIVQAKVTLVISKAVYMTGADIPGQLWHNSIQKIVTFYLTFIAFYLIICNKQLSRRLFLCI